MSKLALYYPAKPYIVTQAWGILNGSYEAAGLTFTKHNGEDFRIGSDKLTHCPLKAIVQEVGYNDLAGNYVRLVSTDQWEIGGQLCYVGMMFMHHEKILCAEKTILNVGDVMGIPDNTGFSTGPHTHGSYLRLVNQNYNGARYDTDTTTDRTFDPHPYWTGFAAQDYTKVVIIQKLISLYQQLMGTNKSA